MTRGHKMVQSDGNGGLIVPKWFATAVMVACMLLGTGAGFGAAAATLRADVAALKRHATSTDHLMLARTRLLFEIVVQLRDLTIDQCHIQVHDGLLPRSTNCSQSAAPSIQVPPLPGEERDSL